LLGMDGWMDGWMNGWVDGSCSCGWSFEVDSAGEWADERGMERDACEGGGMEYMSVSDHCQFLSLVSAVGSLIGGQGAIVSRN
jgi:hypothetical protein